MTKRIEFDTDGRLTVRDVPGAESAPTRTKWRIVLFPERRPAYQAGKQKQRVTRCGLVHSYERGGGNG